MTEQVYLIGMLTMFGASVIFWGIPLVTMLSKMIKQYLFDQKIDASYQLYDFLLKKDEHCWAKEGDKEIRECRMMLLLGASIFGPLTWPVFVPLALVAGFFYCLLRFLRWTIRCGGALKAIGNAAHEHDGETIKKVNVEKVKF